jgi:hypothetical protein
MKIALSQLPPEIYNRMQDIQNNHEEYAGFYLKGGGKGWAITGIVIAMLGLFVMLGMAVDEAFGLFGWICVSAFNVWLLVFSARYIKKFNAKPLKPFTFLNPLYLTKVGLSDVTYYNLWSDREDLNITHHYTNGVYTNTEFEFTFKDGSETLHVAPKARAEELIDQIDAYRMHMIDAIENEDFGAIAAHDLFFELEHGEGAQQAQDEPQTTGFAWKAWGMAAGASFLLAGGFFIFNLYSVQSKQLKECESYRASKYYDPIQCYERYFKYSSPVILTTRAQEGLYGAYKRRYEKSKDSASKLRDLIEQTTFPYLNKAQKTGLQHYYQKEGKVALRRLYDDAISNYKQNATKAYAPAREAIIKLLNIAKAQDRYTVKITYNRKIKALLSQRTYKLRSGRVLRLEPMAPSFTPQYNTQREQVLTNRVKDAFKKIIPEDILQFDLAGDLEFNITYSLRPYTVYTLTNKRTYTKRYYRGIQIFWHFKIIDKGKLLYEFLDTTLPAKSFSVRRRRYSRYGSRRIRNSTMYDRMAETTFDAYTRRILVHFGVVRYLRYSDRKARKTWERYKKLGVLKDLAAGKSFKDIDWKSRLKKAGLKVPPKRRANTRTNRNRRRYRRRRTNRYRRYRRRRYNRYRRRYRRRRPPRRRGGGLDFIE